MCPKLLSGQKCDQYPLGFSWTTEPLGGVVHGEGYSEGAEVILFWALRFSTKPLAVTFVLKLSQPAEQIPRVSECVELESAVACASLTHVMDIPVRAPLPVAGHMKQTAAFLWACLLQRERIKSPVYNSTGFHVSALLVKPSPAAGWSKGLTAGCGYGHSVLGSVGLVMGSASLHTSVPMSTCL